jgi:hypothetical protein
MTSGESRRWRKGIVTLAVLLMLAFGGPAFQSTLARAETQVTEGPYWGVKAEALDRKPDLRLAAIGPPPLQAKRLSQIVSYSAPSTVLAETALFGNSFPKIFDKTIKNESQALHRPEPQPHPQAVNLPVVEDRARIVPLQRVSTRQRSPRQDTLLFALIFKDGHDAWSERQLASLIVNDFSRQPVGSLPMDCRQMNLCGLSDTPVPDTLWLFTAVLIGLFGVGCRRSRPES